MMPLSLILWLMMQGQQRQAPENPSTGYTFKIADTDFRYVRIRNTDTGWLQAEDSDGRKAQLPIQCDPLDSHDPHWTNCHVVPPVAPAEHVIEIRTRRHRIPCGPHVNDCTEKIGCAPDDYIQWFNEENVFACTGYTSREVWIDGVRWGTLKETEAK